MASSFTFKCLLAISLSSASMAQIIEHREDGRAGREISEATTLIYRYKKLHNGVLPKNWSDAWDAKEVAWQYRSLVGRPLVHRQIAFVESADQMTADGSGTRIIAITRKSVPRPFGEKKEDEKDDEPDWINHRLIVFQTKDGKLLQGSVKADKPLRGVNLDRLVLKEPDLTNRQVAETVAAMIEYGFSGDQIWEAFGDQALDAVQKSGLLDPASQNVLSAKPPQLTSTPVAVASRPRPSEAAMPEAKTESPGFPIWLVAILGALIVVAAVFLVRRRSR